MSNERAEELIKKYLAGTATPEEEALLESWYNEAAQAQPEMPGTPDYPRIEAEMLVPLRAQQEQYPIPPFTDAQPNPKPVVKLWPRLVAAASILVILAVGSLFIFRKKPTEPVVDIKPLANDILPAGTKATLTLLDGKTILLDSTSSHTLTRQGNTTVSSQNGQLIYNATQTGGAPALASNTLTTRPGEHYSIQLPDGTKVWLNAASSITYPIAFAGADRTVKVTGECYFEIVHNPKQPFKVAFRGQLVEDIGTRLNINAYDDEPATNTTLLEGSVKVTKGKTSVILKPGQQATTQTNDSAFQIKKVDSEEAIAWKSGYFYFDRADMRTVMRQLARWYDIKVVYKGELPKRTFKGKVYRNIKASEALGILSYFGAHFHIEGKTITVSS